MPHRKRKDGKKERRNVNAIVAESTSTTTPRS